MPAHSFSRCNKAASWLGAQGQGYGPHGGGGASAVLCCAANTSDNIVPY